MSMRSQLFLDKYTVDARKRSDWLQEVECVPQVIGAHPVTKITLITTDSGD